MRIKRHGIKLTLARTKRAQLQNFNMHESLGKATLQLFTLLWHTNKYRELEAVEGKRQKNWPDSMNRVTRHSWSMRIKTFHWFSWFSTKSKNISVRESFLVTLVLLSLPTRPTFINTHITFFALFIFFSSMCIENKCRKESEMSREWIKWRFSRREFSERLRRMDN